MPITSLPFEILQLIVDELPLPSSLLSLGLTCRLFYSLTIPFPLQYRELIWPTGDDDIVMTCAEHILEKPARAKAIRDVRVEFGRCSALPAFLDSNDEARCCDPATNPALSMHALSLCIPSTPHITTLSISSLPPSSLPTLLSLLPHLPNLTSLSLSHTLLLVPSLRSIFASLPSGRKTLERFRIIDPGVWMVGSGGEGWARARVYIWGGSPVQADEVEGGKVVQLPARCPGVESCCEAALRCEDKPHGAHGHRQNWRSLPCATRFFSFCLDGVTVEEAMGELRVVTFTL